MYFVKFYIRFKIAYIEMLYFPSTLFCETFWSGIDFCKTLASSIFLILLCYFYYIDYCLKLTLPQTM
jgi:hypothetical protein